MGNGRIEIAVADAGPLIHLAEIGCLSLLRIFTLLHIPETVWAETVGQGRVAEDDVLKLGIIIRAYRGGLIALEEAQKYIVDLQEISSLFVTRAVVELAIEELHRRVKKVD